MAFLSGNALWCRILSIALVTIIVAISFWGCGEDDTQDPNKEWGEPSDGIRCSIIVESKHWSNGNPAIVSITVENISEGKIDLKTIPAFTLNEMQYWYHMDNTEYWCPVNITGDDYNLPANAYSYISLEKGAQINSVIDISKLGWDLGVSSIWPSKDLYSIVPVGKYKLRLDIQIVYGSESQWIFSNEISIEISEKI